MLWVLGEQSAKTLRGQAMEDVIFAGSSARQAVGVAEVDLVLDNTDGTLPLEFTEVTITRRMYRSRRERVPDQPGAVPGSWTSRTCCTTPASAATRTRSSARAVSTRS